METIKEIWMAVRTWRTLFVATALFALSATLGDGLIPVAQVAMSTIGIMLVVGGGNRRVQWLGGGLLAAAIALPLAIAAIGSIKLPEGGPVEWAMAIAIVMVAVLVATAGFRAIRRWLP